MNILLTYMAVGIFLGVSQILFFEITQRDNRGALFCGWLFLWPIMTIVATYCGMERMADSMEGKS